MPVLPIVSRQHRFPNARVLLALLVLAVSGCASTGDPPRKDTETAAKSEGSAAEAAGAVGGAALGTVGGAAVGALYGLGCGFPGFIICSPVAAVGFGIAGLVKGGEAGAKFGRSVHESGDSSAESGDSSNATQPAADESPSYVAAEKSPSYIAAEKSLPYIAAEESPSYIEELPGSDFSPPGSLLVYMHRIQAVGPHDFSGTLLVNLYEAPDGSRRSIEEDVVVACTTGAVTFVWRRTYDDWYRSGEVVTSEPSTIGIAPGPQLDAVVRKICNRESADG